MHFFSRELTLAVRNYDIGHRELPAVKVAPEESRHWLEGAEHPFLVWTNHKNLEYLRTAKRLNSHQARWSLFINQFIFQLSYRPGSKNAKPDAFSQANDPESSLEEVALILPRSCVVGAISWGIEERVIGFHPIDYLCLKNCQQQSSNGFILLDFPVTPVSNELCLWFFRGFGGQLFTKTLPNTSLLVRPVPIIRTQLDLPVDYLCLFLFLAAHGLTSLWTLLLVCQHLRETQSFCCW